MIARCPELEPKFYDALREAFGSQTRSGIHLSGLLNPRKEAWQFMAPIPPTDEELGYFTAGRGHEDVLSKFVGLHFKSTDEATVEGIHMRPDFQAITGAIIPIDEYAEFKTRRSNLPENDDEAQEEFSSYRAQVRGYMALRRRNRMYLIVLSLVEGKTQDALSRSSPQFAIYEETMTDAEIMQELEKLRARRDALQRIKGLHGLATLGAFPSLPPDAVQQAIKLELVLLPLCEAWMCGKSYPNVKVKAKCETCGQEFESAEFGPKKHVESKKGAGHVVTPAVIEWEYEPRCKWHTNYCKPFEVDPERGAR